MSTDIAESPLQAAQRRKLEIEISKLELDSTMPWYKSPSQLIPILSAAIAVISFWAGSAQYFYNQYLNRIAAEQQFMKPWLDDQRQTYLDGLTAASTLATTEDGKVFRKAEGDFWKLFYGKMILVETTKVCEKMKAFGLLVRAQDHYKTAMTDADRTAMTDAVKNLATAMHDSMGETAGMNFETFQNNQFKYGMDRFQRSSNSLEK